MPLGKTGDEVHQADGFALIVHLDHAAERFQRIVQEMRLHLKLNTESS